MYIGKQLEVCVENLWDLLQELRLKKDASESVKGHVLARVQLVLEQASEQTAIFIVKSWKRRDFEEQEVYVVWRLYNCIHHMLVTSPELYQAFNHTEVYGKLQAIKVGLDLAKEYLKAKMIPQNAQYYAGRYKHVVTIMMKVNMSVDGKKERS